MRLVFAGTPEFSVAALEALVAAGHEIAGVYTQPDRPAGRGRKLSASPVAQRAEQLGIALFKPAKLRGDDDAITQLRALAPDCIVVVAYGLILPQEVLDIPAHGCINIHASLLPRWRGAAPIQRAILAGDTQSGVTIMRMDQGLDTGAMLLRGETPITEQTTAGQLHNELSSLGARLIVETLARLDNGDLDETPQPDIGATYASKLDKQEARIDWGLANTQLLRAIHGYNPVPGAWSLLADARIKLLRAKASALSPVGHSCPGDILEINQDGIHVATGDGILCLTEIQRPGAKPMPAHQAFGQQAPIGQRFA